MWNDRLRIAESVLPQWRALSGEERAAARQALEAIDDDPICGAPLYEPLRGTWSLHADGLRILYRIFAEARFVAILSITHR
ncbi:MAG TPA: type II toxin-antitoxin system RelE/ParE family toxin [Thermoanaerobaculia bacterium]|nr:type II toxin-antitoxin system RelE/ParE family toxin [Thermoanaerobaculia bacterium]